MVDIPWLGSSAGEATTEATGRTHDDAVVVCEFHDGTLAVYEDRVVIDRSSRSQFADKTIPVEDITGVDYAKGITIGYLQIEQVGVEPDTGGWLSDPVNENTLHFGRRSRECAREAQDEILARATG